jgi:ornithine cyclodeaminase/alanine dehydrogenase-like protein (mu-crystallin family)
VLVSRRSEEKSRSLLEQYPSTVEIVDNAAEIVSRSDIIFIGTSEFDLLFIQFDDHLVKSKRALTYGGEVDFTRDNFLR